jgi:hypothetical protein
MSAGAVFRLIANDGKTDRLLTASEMLRQRIARLGEDVQLADIEKTHLLYTRAHFSPFAAVGFEYNKVRPQSGTATLGGGVTFSIPQFGDFFHDMVCRVRLGPCSTNVGTIYEQTLIELNEEYRRSAAFDALVDAVYYYVSNFNDDRKDVLGLYLNTSILYTVSQGITDLDVDQCYNSVLDLLFDTKSNGTLFNENDIGIPKPIEISDVIGYNQSAPYVYTKRTVLTEQSPLPFIQMPFTQTLRDSINSTAISGPTNDETNPYYSVYIDGDTQCAATEDLVIASLRILANSVYDPQDDNVKTLTIEDELFNEDNGNIILDRLTIGFDEIRNTMNPAFVTQVISLFAEKMGLVNSEPRSITRAVYEFMLGLVGDVKKLNYAIWRAMKEATTLYISIIPLPILDPEQIIVGPPVD